MADKKNGVKELVEKLKNLEENEAIAMYVEQELREIDDYFRVQIGYFAREGVGSYAIRVIYGRTPLLKIRNKIEFEAIATLINYLKENPKYIEALEKLNGNGRRKKKTANVEYI